MKKKKNAPSKHRHLLLMVLFATLLLLTVTAVVITSVVILDRTTREHRTQTIEYTAKLAATRIDGDKVNEWMENGVDEAYESTYDVLESILHNTPFLQYLYAYQIKEDGCHVIFDFDSVDDGCVTIRNRDTMEQERVAIDKLSDYLTELVKF